MYHGSDTFDENGKSDVSIENIAKLKLSSRQHKGQDSMRTWLENYTLERKRNFVCRDLYLVSIPT
jgi:hypothetical protein